MKKIWKLAAAGVLAAALITSGLSKSAVVTDAAESSSREVSEEAKDGIPDEKGKEPSDGDAGTSGDSLVEASGNDATLEDGTYQIFGRLWQATREIPSDWKEDSADGASMGDGALNHNISVTVKDGKATLNLEFVRMTYTLFGEASSGYLKNLNYFPGYTGDALPEDQTPVAAKVDSYWEDGNGNRISDEFGTDYPRNLEIPLDEAGQQVVWVQVYVPIMESIGKSSGSDGMGTQYAKIVLDWNGDTGNSNKDSETLDPSNLSDGIYKVDGTMVKVDKKTYSMSNDAIVHHIKLEVKNGTYYVTMDFRGLTVGQRLGYLSTLKYFKTGYTLNSFGQPEGDLGDVTVDSYQTYTDGSRVSDQYGTDYPDQVTFELIPEAKSDGYVPLQVFVPIMEAISSGTGTQPVFLKLDWSSIKKTTADDADFKDTSSNGAKGSSTTNSSSSTTSGTNTNSGLSNGLKRSSLSGSSLKSSTSAGGSSLKSGSLTGGNSLKSSSLKNNSLSGNGLKNSTVSSNSLNRSSLTKAGGAETDDSASSEMEKWAVVMIAAAFTAFVSLHAKERSNG